MSIANERNTKMGRNVKLVAALVLLAPELIVSKEELLGPFEQASVGGVVEAVGLLKRGKISVNEFEFFIGFVRLGIGRDG